MVGDKDPGSHSGSATFSYENLPSCLIQDLFVARAQKAPERPAVFSSTRTLSYGDLLKESRAWARKLRQLGVKPNTLVAIVMEKGWEQIVAVMGILLAGAAYLPIDPKFPKDRLAYVLKNSEARIALTQPHLDSELGWPDALERLIVDEVLPETVGDMPVAESVSTEDLAYVIYTSGSTGKPKGVMISHRSIVNCVLDTNRTFHVGPEDRAIAITALHHDLSVYDIFGMLAAGGAIVIPEASASRSPDRWAELIDHHRVSVWNSVPGFMEMLLQYAAAENLELLGRLRLVILGGDWVPVSAPGRIHKHFGPAQVVTIGGPTETTVWNIWFPVEKVDPAWHSIPYGHAIANTRYYVLDEGLRDCPSGEPGELCCSGASLMLGYWRDQALTHARVTTHPVNGEKIFRTGDRGRLLPSGEIEFLGRIDAQVKINGQRIELGEIEAELLRFPSIKQAAVKVVQSASQLRLAAYLVSEEGARPPRTDAIREQLARNLPDYMMPFAFIPLAALPVNGNGKVDRAALPQPVEDERAEAAAVASGDSIEDMVAGIWRKVLSLPKVGADDNFFDLGGNSLRVVQVHSQLQQVLKRSLSITDLFEFPSVRSLARHLGNTAAKPAGISATQMRADRQRSAMTRLRPVTK